MPPWAARNVEEFRRLNPDYAIFIHGPEVLLDRYRRIYDATSRPPRGFAQRADLLRLSALQRYGGWYFDIDFWPMRPVADVVRAYRLDGNRMVVSEQHGHKNRKLTVGNGILMAEPDTPAWDVINQQLDAMPDKPGDIALGPGLFTRLVGQRPDVFTMLRWPWFFPAPIGEAVDRYNRLISGDKPADVFWDKMHHTLGQIPFGLHLWAGGQTELKGTGRAPRGEMQHRPTGMTIGLLATGRQWADATQPFAAIAEGFRALGCTVRVAEPTSWPCFDGSFDPQVIVMWNGRKNRYIGISSAARASDKIVLTMEHGFFDRRAYTQLDFQGILHWSSWAGSLTTPSPPDGAARLAKVWPDGVAEFGPRDGYVLVLGQVPGDSQLQESEIRKPNELIRLVAGNLPTGLEARFRPHPNRAKHTASPARYMKVCNAKTLKEAVAGARFAVTINSNAGNECLAWGCPVLAFGPALYCTAGVARTVTRDAIVHGLQAMADGVRPGQAAVQRYSEHLACRQYSIDDLAGGGPIMKVLTEAAGNG